MRTSRRSDRGYVWGRGNNGYMRYKEGGCTCSGVNIGRRRGGSVHQRSTACSPTS